MAINHLNSYSTTNLWPANVTCGILCYLTCVIIFCVPLSYEVSFWVWQMSCRYSYMPPWWLLPLLVIPGDIWCNVNIPFYPSSYDVSTWVVTACGMNYILASYDKNVNRDFHLLYFVWVDQRLWLYSISHTEPLMNWTTVEATVLYEQPTVPYE